MFIRKRKTNKRFKTKRMNCAITVIVALLALFLHFVNHYLREKVKIYPKTSSRRLSVVSRSSDKSNSRKLNVRVINLY